MEKIVLYATSLGLDTCWLGGTYTASCFTKALNFYNPNSYNLVYKAEFAEGEEEILSFKKIDEDTLLITNDQSARIIRFKEAEPKKITYEVIQEIKETTL